MKVAALHELEARPNEPLLRREPQGLLGAADHWLHEAKRHGRNQVRPIVVNPVIPA